MNMTCLISYVSSYSEGQQYNSTPRRSCMQKCLIVLFATETFSV